MTVLPFNERSNATQLMQVLAKIVGVELTAAVKMEKFPRALWIAADMNQEACDTINRFVEVLNKLRGPTLQPIATLHAFARKPGRVDIGVPENEVVDILNLLNETGSQIFSLMKIWGPQLAAEKPTIRGQVYAKG